MRWRMGGVDIEVVRGDITELDVDAIVNPANSLLVMGGGVAGAIKRKGGESIEREAVKHAPLRIGEAVATSGGRLKARYVIHAPTMEMPAMRTTLEKVARATEAALKLAVDMGLKTVAFPGMGTGVGGLPVYEAVKAMLGAVSRVLERGGGRIRKIIFVAYSEEDHGEFLRAVSDFLSAGGGLAGDP